MSVVVPRLSATILLLSRNAPSLCAASSPKRNNNNINNNNNNDNNDFEKDATCDFKVLMVRRHDKARFMPNKYVFPGGSVEEHDITLANRMQIPVPRIIALRELSEETQCVLRGDGSLCTSHYWKEHNNINNDNKEKSFSNKLHTSINKSTNSMSESNYDVSAASQLTLLARWITPTVYPYRYDTYFYGAIVNNKEYVSANIHSNAEKEICDENQEQNVHAQEITLCHQSEELTEANWYTPTDILRQHESVSAEYNNYSVAPITYFMLHALSQYNSLKEIETLWEDVRKNSNINESNINAIISEEDRPDEYYMQNEVGPETRLHIPANYLVHMSEKAILSPGRYNIVKECKKGKERITHLTIGSTNLTKSRSNSNSNDTDNFSDANYKSNNVENEDEILLRH